ncbi:Glycosyltransferase involved in cell wall bisynthesis [Chitinophaga sp. YR573]|uniref:glycosyltransferase family protein n=1 Tax=Chitinophaga sp. YR573 TaxID=1881040 RepID=UPI0008BDF916|nr:glycosyltransferase [Chitinophaga sp. YR573]SEV88817.1 Glycosyltransferase involved in cell wall bisynthesis [Chitinophaga sp. YR573]
MIKALALYKPDSGCDYHRITLPFQYEDGRVDNEAFDKAGSKLRNKLKVAELVIWNRDFPLGIDAAIEFQNKYGFKVVVDLDDYWHLYPHHFLSAYYRRNKIAEIMIRNIKLADAVTVTTTRLADMVRPYNANVHVIPNALPYGHGQFNDQRLPARDHFSFIYAGQRSHLHDLKQVAGPLKHIASKNRHDIGFILAGYHHHPDDTSLVWPMIEDIMSANGTMPNYARIEQQALEEYMNVYGHADATIVPLENNTFNSCKSNLKLLEAAAKHLPVICQQVPPYSDCDAPVLWVKKSRDWVEHIRYLADNREKAAELGEQLHEWATTNYNLFAWNKYRFDLYDHIVKH